MTSRCPCCAEPAPCLRCVEPETSPFWLTEREPRWSTIVAAAFLTIATIVATWTGVLF